MKIMLLRKQTLQLVKKSSLRLIVAIASSKKWRINFVDVQSAFLQGENISRDIYIIPPKEANTNKLWKLIKPVYGLKVASRKWYDKVCNSLIELGMCKIRYDPSLFYWYKDGSLHGVMGGHVDDFFWSGSDDFESIIINNVCKRFKISCSGKNNFPFLGLQIKQELDGITRPDILFEVCQLSAAKNCATIKHIQLANKVIRKLKNTNISLKFPCLVKEISDCKLIVYSDASFNNLPNGGSQGAHIIFICDSSGNVAPIKWQSKRIKRVVKSTLAAECMALHDGVDNAFYMKTILKELVGVEMDIHGYVDNNSLVESLYSTTNVKEDKRLVVDMNALKEMIEKLELKSVTWRSGKHQIADVMTKSGVSPLQIQNVLNTGKLPLSTY